MAEYASLKGMKKNEIKNLTSIAYETIKNSIINNEIKPGDHLSETIIAETLGMSRTPIREAIKILQSEDLVEVHNGVGIFVKHVTIKDIYELFEVRAALECTALRSAMENITEGEINHMEEKWMKLKNRADLGEEIDLDEIAHWDSELHSLIVRKCNNSYLIDIMSSVKLKVLRFQRMSAKSLGNEKDTISQHMEILKVMKERDINKLSELLRIHIKKAGENIANNPDWNY
ncbi:MAG: GntR family transcriptional regulator [Clostridium lundense]|nr:GntR family transcriptional regulator [Clostridium lundense]